MILHLVEDEKFIDTAYRIFEHVYPGRNEFVLLTTQRRTKFIRRTPVEVMSPRRLLRGGFARDLSRYEFTALHYMTEVKMRFVNQAPREAKFVWFGWGKDYYDFIAPDPRMLLLPLTGRLYDERSPSSLKRLVQRSKRVAEDLLYGKLDKAAAVNRVGYFAPVLYEDYELFAAAVLGFKPRYLPWNYGTLEDDMIRGLDSSVVNGRNILLGNSASYENNHLDSFEWLRHMDLKGRSILCPLSYGDPNYRDVVIRAGETRLGDKFVAIVDFLPIDDYLRLIPSCSVVIMNHLRQQGLGNIITMMYLGARVFLNSRNPIFTFLQKEGAHVSCIDDLKEDQGLLNATLSQVEMEHNRALLRRHWSRDVIEAKTRRLVEEVTSDQKWPRISE